MKILIICAINMAVLLLVESRRLENDYQYYLQCDKPLKLHYVPTTWEEARLRCRLEGGHIASPTPDMLDAMLYAMGSIDKVFTGIHATYSKGDFFTEEGQSMFDLPLEWADSEPDNYGGDENCIGLNRKGLVSDEDCSGLHPFICYKNKHEMILNQCNTSDNNYVLEPRTGSCYKFHSSPHVWPKAHMICAAEGAYLAIINSDVEAEVIKDLFSKHPANSLPISTDHKDSILLGFRDTNDHEDWLTIHGQTLTQAGYDKFSQGQPDSRGAQPCGGAFRTGLLDDIGCDKKVAFVCEKNPAK